MGSTTTATESQPEPNSKDIRMSLPPSKLSGDYHFKMENPWQQRRGGTAESLVHEMIFSPFVHSRGNSLSSIHHISNSFPNWVVSVVSGLTCLLGGCV